MTVTVHCDSNDFVYTLRTFQNTRREAECNNNLSFRKIYFFGAKIGGVIEVT
jgi:hypothetical protein